MIRKILPYTGIILLLFLGRSIAVEEYCDTELNLEQLMYEQSDLPGFLGPDEMEQEMILSISAHIVRNHLGEEGIAETDVLRAVERMNESFSGSKLSFEVCTFNYIDKTRFSKFSRNEEKALTRANVPNTINVYFLPKILSGVDGSICGYTYYPTKGLDHIILNNSCLANGTTLTHEMGHFFG